MKTPRSGDSFTGRKAGGALLVGLLALLSAGAMYPKPSGESDTFTSNFRLQDCDFSTTGRNIHFILKPGRRLVLEGEKSDGTQVRLLITVLRQTRRITLDIGGRSRRVETRIVEERETEDGELVEVSRNFFAIEENTRDVYYFGEEGDDYEDGEIVGHEGEWLAGRDGAMPGIIMPGTFLLGSRYFQEIAPAVALDRAEHTLMGLTIETPFGELENCVEVIETSPLEPGSESRKLYAPGIGLIADGDILLVDVIEDVHNDEDEEDD